MILIGTTILVVVITTVIIHLYSNSNEENKSYLNHETKISAPARQFLSLDTIDSQTTMTSYSLTTKFADNSDSSQVEVNLFPISDMDSGTASKHNSNFSILCLNNEILPELLAQY